MKFFPILCLLTLTVACQKTNESAHAKTNTPVKQLQINTLKESIANAKKPFVVVNFFDTQCKGCEKEIPSLVELQKADPKEAELMFIAMDSTAEMQKKLPSFLQTQQIEQGVYIWQGKSATIKELYADWDGSLPLTLLLNQKGEVLEHLKVTDKNELEMLIQTHTLMPE